MYLVKCYSIERGRRVEELEYCRGRVVIVQAAHCVGMTVGTTAMVPEMAAGS